MLGRRGLLGAAAAVAVAAPARAQWWPFGAKAAAPQQDLKPLPARHNDKYAGGRPLTPEADATTYNNFYEFGSDKDIAAAAQALPVAPWTIEIAGMVAKPRTIGLEDLLKQVSLEERDLSPSLRGGVGDDGAVDRLPDGRPGEAGRAAPPAPNT